MIYREDQEFNVNELIPTKNNSANKFDLIIASQPYRSRISVKKSRKQKTQQVRIFLLFQE